MSSLTSKMYDSSIPSSNCFRCQQKLFPRDYVLDNLSNEDVNINWSNGEVSFDPSHPNAAIFTKFANMKGYMCDACGATYCYDCLAYHAPDYPTGGKACIKCGGTIGLYNPKY